MSNNNQASMPVTNRLDLKDLEQGLLDRSPFGRREFTIWKLGVATCLSIKCLVSLKRKDVYNPNGAPKAYVDAKGAGEVYFKPAWQTLNDYWHWIEQYHVQSKWMFPSFPSSLSPHDTHIKSSRFYIILRNVGRQVGIDHLGNSSPRKTGALQIYSQTKNFGLVMHMLHQRDLPRAKQFLGLSSGCDQTFLIHSLNKVAFY